MSHLLGALIEWCARHKYTVIAASLLGRGRGRFFSMRAVPVDAIPDLSDRRVISHRVDGAQPARWSRTRSPTRSPPRCSPRPASRRARQFRCSACQLRLRHLRGRHGHLLGAQRVLEYLHDDRSAAARRASSPSSGRTRPAWAGSTSTPWWTGPAKHDLAELRTFQDWSPALRAADRARRGRGGHRRRLREAVPGHRRPDAARGLGMTARATWARPSAAPTRDVGGRVLEMSGREYMVRGRGYIRSPTTSRQVAVKRRRRGTPVLRRDIGTVELRRRHPPRRQPTSTGRARRSGGIVVMRHGENALEVIERVKAEARRDAAAPCPRASRCVPVYDRSRPHRARRWTRSKHTLIEESARRRAGHLRLPAARAQRARGRSSRCRWRCCSPSSRCAAWASPPTSCRWAASPSPSARWWTRPSSWWRTPTSSWSTCERRRRRSRVTAIVAARRGGGARRSSSRCSSSRWPSCPSSRSTGRRAGCSSRWPTPRPSAWASRRSWR